MNLVRAETQRLLARRFTQVMLVFLLAAFGVTFATVVASTHLPTEAEIVRAEQNAAAAREGAEQWYRECLAANTATGDSGRAIERCGHGPGPMETSSFLPNVFVFTDEIRPLLYFLTAFLTLFGFLVGASYVGADLTSGSMTNLLLWRPERGVVLGTKLAVLLGAVLATALVATGLYVGAFWSLGTLAGLPGDATGQFWIDTWLFLGRGIMLALLSTALGFAVATLGRHTAAALGTLAGYVVLWEMGARIVMNVVDWRRGESLMGSAYIIAWLQKSYTFHTGCMTEFGACRETVTYREAGLVFAAMFVAVVGAAFVNFRRRDLT